MKYLHLFSVKIAEEFNITIEEAMSVLASNPKFFVPIIVNAVINYTIHETIREELIKNFK